jgi:hypothetical protein
MKIIFYDIETGKDLEGDYFIDDKGRLWNIEFGSANHAETPTCIWAGEGSLIDKHFGIRIETK